MIDAVIKSDETVFVTAPVLVPGEKDCDYNRGEIPLTKKQVQEFAHSFSNYGFIEKDHDILVTKQTVGKPVESYITPVEVSLRLVDGSIKSYPNGTWFVKSKVTDKETQERVLKGELNGYSITALPRPLADKYKDLIATKSSEGKLIKDLDDPVGFAISLVEVPCVSSAKICNISKKGDKVEEEKIDKKGVIDIVKKTFGLKEPEEPEYVTKSELESAFKAHTEAIEEVLSEKLSSFDEYVKKAEEDDEKKKKKKAEEDGEGDTGEEEDTGGEESSTNDEEDDEKKKKKKGSSKSLKVGEKLPETSMKSETEIVMKAMGRDIRGTPLKNKE